MSGPVLRPGRTLEHDVLTLAAVLAAALAGRTSADHAARAARRAAESARVRVWGATCAVCGRQLAARRWVIYRGAAYDVSRETPLASGRAYCRRHCAEVQLHRGEVSHAA